MSADVDAAAARAAEFVSGPDEAEEETPSSPEEPAAEAEEAQPEAEAASEEDFLSLIDNYKAEPGEEEEPDFEAEAEEDLIAQAPEEEEEYVDDPALLEERKKRLAAEKKLAWMEGQRLQSESSKWREQAGKRWPLSKPFLDDIDAKSHRAFNREAQKIQQRLEPWFEENYAGPLKGYLDKEREKIREEERAKAAESWGRPSAGPGTVPIESSERQAKYEQAAKTGDLVEMIKARAFEGGEQ